MAEIPDNLRKPILSFLEDIQSVCSLDKVILYGSSAKGNYKEGSDVDLAIFSKSANDKNRLALMAKIFTKISKYKLDIQPLVFGFYDFNSKDNTFIQEEIKNKGIVLK